jgi:two-component system heavy metal sensor histidine kinase CusS
VSDARETSELDRFAAAVAHEIRTPLTAVAGEIEVALRRDRTAVEYREVLRRIASGVAELVAISGDLALLNEPLDRSRDTVKSARVAAILGPIAERYVNDVSVRVAAGDEAAVLVAGDEQRLRRAVALVVEHALRHRRANAIVTVRVANGSGAVAIAVEAQPPGFWPLAWSSLSADAANSAAPLRLRTARRILDESGGALRVAGPSATDAVHIELHVPA